LNYYAQFKKKKVLSMWASLANVRLYLFTFFPQKEEQLGSETGSSSEDQYSETELGIDELQLLLQAMQFRRYIL